MPDTMLAAACAAVLLAGCLIGISGIGGVLVVPALGVLLNIPVDRAIAAASCAFLVTGAAALVQARGTDATGKSESRILLFASIPGAVLGAMCVGILPETALLVAVAAISLFSGIWGLVRFTDKAEDARPSRGRAGAWGAAVGFGSAVTGTGGPVLLTPILMLSRQPTRRIVAMGQLIQFPIALCATVAHASRGRLDVALVTAVSLVLLVGMLVGSRLSAALPVPAIRASVCWLLVAVGLGLGIRALV